MQAAIELSRDLVLVGGGHSHALALRMFAMRPIEGVRITLISPDSHTPYSGMLPGLIAGHYTYSDSHIDLSRLCEWANVRFICDEVTGLDIESRRLQFRDRPPVGYDLLSLDIGSQPELDSVPGASEFATPVKPVAGLWQRWQELETSLTETHKHLIGIVGGGAGSVELALAMSYRLKDIAIDGVRISLWCGAPEILQGYNARARRVVMDELAAAGISVAVGARVQEVSDGQLVLEDGSSHGFDTLFWCTAAAAAPWIKASGLAVDAQGFLAVDDALQSETDPGVFAAGDIATLVRDPRPKAGVYAVRQAPVLAYNLRAMLLGKPLQSFRPQRRFLSLLSLGCKKAVADKGFFSASGSWVWRWKDRIDRKFMDQFANLSLEMAGKSADHLPDYDPRQQSVCGGCGAKVGAKALASTLEVLSRSYPEHCRKSNDDAVPIPGGSDRSTQQGPVLQSVDVLRQIIQDPWTMGRIAANHALSDLYACGARPVSALAAVTLPFATANLLERDLQQILAGALEAFSAADCELSGGHSMKGSELQLGFTVNGIPMSAGVVMSKTGVREGDALILTKPLGIGVLFAAQMQLAVDGRAIKAAIETMLLSNARAAELALEFAAHACTDITGFGLLGHLLEMLEGGWSAQLDLENIPVLGGVYDCLDREIVSTAHWDNVASHGHALSMGAEVNRSRGHIVFDPQTSGGLLVSLPPERAEKLCTALKETGHCQAALIGTVQAPAQGLSAVVLS